MRRVTGPSPVSSAWQQSPFAVRRMAQGAAAPLPAPVALRRRRLQRRTLCSWQHEDAGLLLFHEPTEPGVLDIDVLHGLFAVNASEPPQGWPPQGGSAADPANLAVAYQDGFTMHVGARAASREAELVERFPRPTRLVSRSGHLHRGAPADWLQIERHTTLAEALDAIATDPAEEGIELVQIEDSSTYLGEQLTWPAGIRQLTIRAAERERPLVHFASWDVEPGLQPMQELRLVGLALYGPVPAPPEGPLPVAVPGALVLPPAEQIRLDFCTMVSNRSQLQVSAHESGTTVTAWRCLLGPLVLEGGVTAGIVESVIDSGAGAGSQALAAEDGRLDLDRVTVFGFTECQQLYATEAIFIGDIVVEDRFHGCVRFSRVRSEDGLPRRHRLAVGTKVQLVSTDRDDPAYARLAESCDTAIRRGAEDGSEMGVFHDVRMAERYQAFRQRLREYTPANLTTGLIRLD
jgi:hypothetical protein